MNCELSQYKRFCAGYFNQWGTFMYVGMKLLLILVFGFVTVIEAQRSRCLQPIKVGPCMALIPRWAYDRRKRRCVPFSYGGCQANGNNFMSKGECRRACMRF
ncbi:Kunitz/Bovine pancreatic trypsin inhibitor domain protein [Ancylostoma caninum]|uniref:Kunitz/Bovine pancreatic trypsin inhibitor domain protein n=1 Tax=Ancylostoma caninum TaxID=29170 RepID=A0A368EYL7_ANCCA|nr:Kunitz/Bovine pancreatic trypsin inhibitor domain protein [Ancylostoma caninum]